MNNSPPKKTSFSPYKAEARHPLEPISLFCIKYLIVWVTTHSSKPLVKRINRIWDKGQSWQSPVRTRNEYDLLQCRPSSHCSCTGTRKPSTWNRYPILLTGCPKDTCRLVGQIPMPKENSKCGINKVFLILSYLIVSSASQPGWKPHCSFWIQGSSNIISTLVYTLGWGMWFPWSWNTPSDPLKKETMSWVCSSEAMLQTSMSQRRVSPDNPTTSRVLRDLSTQINFLNKTEPIIAY